MSTYPIEAAHSYFKDLAPVVADRIAQRHQFCYRSALAQLVDIHHARPTLAELGIHGRDGRVDWQLWLAVADQLRHYIRQGHDCGCVALWDGRAEDGRLLVV